MYGVRTSPEFRAKGHGHYYVARVNDYEVIQTYKNCTNSSPILCRPACTYANSRWHVPSARNWRRHAVLYNYSHVHACAWFMLTA